MKYFIMIEVSRSNKGIILTSIKYVSILLQGTSLSACQPVDILIEEGLKLYVESNHVPITQRKLPMTCREIDVLIL